MAPLQLVVLLCVCLVVAQSSASYQAVLAVALLLPTMLQGAVIQSKLRAPVVGGVIAGVLCSVVASRVLLALALGLGGAAIVPHSLLASLVAMGPPVKVLCALAAALALAPAPPVYAVVLLGLAAMVSAELALHVALGSQLAGAIRERRPSWWVKCAHYVSVLALCFVLCKGGAAMVAREVQRELDWYAAAPTS